MSDLTKKSSAITESAIQGLTTRQRASAILSKPKLDELEKAGITVVSAAEWYQMQANLAGMRTMLESFSSDSPHRENCAGCMDSTSHTSDCRLAKALQSDAGKAFAERAQALERLYEAVKIFHITPRADLGRATVVTALRTLESTLDELEARCTHD